MGLNWLEMEPWVHYLMSPSLGLTIFYFFKLIVGGVVVVVHEKCNYVTAVVLVWTMLDARSHPMKPHESQRTWSIAEK